MGLDLGLVLNFGLGFGEVSWTLANSFPGRSLLGGSQLGRSLLCRQLGRSLLCRQLGRSLLCRCQLGRSLLGKSLFGRCQLGLF